MDYFLSPYTNNLFSYNAQVRTGVTWWRVSSWSVGNPSFGMDSSTWYLTLRIDLITTDDIPRPSQTIENRELEQNPSSIKHCFNQDYSKVYSKLAFYWHCNYSSAGFASNVASSGSCIAITNGISSGYSVNMCWHLRVATILEFSDLREKVMVKIMLLISSNTTGIWKFWS